MVELEFTKTSWKSTKSVMVVAKNLRAEKNSFMILEAQTKDVSMMFEELVAKIENNYHIETKKNIDTTYSSRMLLLSNKLYNKFNIIRNFFQIENSSLDIEDNYFNLKSAIIYTIDLLSMSLHSNSHISLDFDPCLPTEVKGDRPKFQQILSSLMELAVQMTDVGEISLKSILEGCDRKEKLYRISFDIKFTPTSPHSKIIISQLLFDPAGIQRQELRADLK